MSYPYYGQQNINPQSQNVNMNSNQQYSYNYMSPTQPLFPQPNGNVYNINNTLEVANVPAGAGMSVALCFSENLMYIKTMQNGTPMFWAYRILPYDSKDEKEEASNQNINEDNIVEELKNYKKKIDLLEKQIISIKKDLGGHTNEEF